MIIVTGSALIRPGSIDDALRVSTEHVLRSRGEPGCISHAVFLEAENPRRLHFLERWSDMAALKVHFAVPESGAFVRALSALASEPPSMEMYEATQLAHP